MWYEVQEGITQQSTRSKAQQHLEQVLVLVAVGLDWDQKQDEERSRTDQQSGSDCLQKTKINSIADVPQKRYMLGKRLGL